MARKKEELIQTEPEHPVSQFLGTEEVEAIKIARRALPDTMRRLVMLTREKSSSQSRQAIELLLNYGLANRQQQYDMQTYQPVDDTGGTPAIALTLNKVELRLAEIMQNMPPELSVQFAELIEQIERQAEGIALDIVDGDELVIDAEIIDEDNDAPFCGCGCGERVLWNKQKKEYAKYRKGHHLRKHMRHASYSPQEIKRLKEAGQWPPRDADGNPLVGINRDVEERIAKQNEAKAKKDRIRAKKREAAIKKAELELAKKQGRAERDASWDRKNDSDEDGFDDIDPDWGEVSDDDDD